jgi:3-dehydroquinate dehydratase II
MFSTQILNADSKESLKNLKSIFIKNLYQVGMLLLLTFFSFSSISAKEIFSDPLKPKKILLIQGANMSYLGKRDPDHYGSTTAAQLDDIIILHAKSKGYEIEIFYTNTEGQAIDKIYSAVENGVGGIVMNPGGFTYSGISLRDCLIAVPVPYVEIHMLSEKDWSGESVTMAAADGKISGFGIDSYTLGLDAMLSLLSKQKK